jgi:hypothetical protein
MGVVTCQAELIGKRVLKTKKISLKYTFLRHFPTVRDCVHDRLKSPNHPPVENLNYKAQFHHNHITSHVIASYVSKKFHLKILTKLS